MSVTGASPTVGQALPPVGSTVRPRHSRNNRSAYLYLAPIIISALVFTIAPFILTLYYSFTNWDLRFRRFNYSWVGLDNYRDVFATGGAFYPVLGWTVAFMVITTLVNVGVGMFLALLLNHPGLRERNVYRTLLIIPWALPFILLIQVWGGIFNDQATSPLNAILTDIGLNPVAWTSEVAPARFAVLAANLWFSYPFFMTVGLAALQAIPRDLYEVADLDGAGWLSRFRDITFPFLLTAVMPLLITQAAFQFNNAGIIILLTNGRPGTTTYGATDTLASLAYKTIFEKQDPSLAAAYGFVVFLIIASFTIVNAVVTRSFEEAA